jgi:antirestriction protein ArdC
LVAELGAAFTCAHLGLSTTPREDHAEYIQFWLRMMQANKQAIFAAGYKAQRASDWLIQ